MNHGPDASDNIAARFLGSADLKCPHCRYSLQNLHSDRCPECGALLRLEVSSVSGDRCFTWWFAILGCALGTAIGGYLGRPMLDSIGSLIQNPALPQLVAAGMAPASDLPNWHALARIIGCIIICFAVLAHLLCCRARWGALPRRWQWATAGIGLSLPGVCIVFSVWP